MFRFAQLSCALALAAAALSAQTVPVPASVETTAMVGIAEGQTAQLNLLNPGVLAPAVGVLCSANVAFVDATGTVVKTALVMVAPGKSASVAVRSDTDLAIAAGERREIRATIAMPAIVPPPTAAGTATPMIPACTLVPTLEIFDTTTGRTMVTLGHTVSVP